MNLPTLKEDANEETAHIESPEKVMQNNSLDKEPYLEEKICGDEKNATNMHDIETIETEL